MLLRIAMFLVIILSSALGASEFTADLVMVEADDTISGKIYVHDQTYRMDLKEQEEYFVIVDQKSCITRAFLPAEMIYVELDCQDFTTLMNDPIQSFVNASAKSELKSEGTEQYAGYKCTKQTIYYEGRAMASQYKSDILNFPLKIVNLVREGQFFKLSNITEKDLSDTLFAIPAGYELQGTPVSKEEGSQNEFIEAAGSGDTAKVKGFIENGANLDMIDDYGYSPLMIAVSYGHLECARMLLEAGADPNLANSVGDTPLYYAAQNGYTKIADMLIRFGADINAFRSFQQSPLGAAVANGQFSAVKLLIESGADVSITDSTGNSLIDIARENGDLQMVEMLKKAGAQ